MRLSYPSAALGLTIGTQTTLLLQSLFILTQSHLDNGLRGSREQVEGDLSVTPVVLPDDTIDMGVNESQELKSLLLREKLNAKFNSRLKIAGAGRDYSLFTDEECSPYPESFKLSSRADIGILSRCSNPNDICIKDSDSFLGGVCARSSDDMEPIRYEEHFRVKQRARHLLQTQSCTYSNGTTGGVKCKGWHACYGLDELFISNNIGCGSCNGYGSCWGISGKFKSSVQEV
jgi:hypothetical protein